MELCSIENCWNLVYAKNLCKMHYQRLRRVGDPNITLKSRRTVLPKPILHSSYAEIPLTKGLYARIDLEDVEAISKYFWHVAANNYAARREGDKIIYMHQDLLKAEEGTEIDHDDRNGLNNRRYNIKAVTHQENMLNSITSLERTGIGFDRTHRKYKAYIDEPFSKRVNIGTFRTREKAVQAIEKYRSDSLKRDK